jgi:hypothetical protein
MRIEENVTKLSQLVPIFTIFTTIPKANCEPAVGEPSIVVAERAMTEGKRSVDNP